MKGMDRMHLLCQVSGKKRTATLEKKVIRHFRHMVGNLNKREGGQGVVDGTNFIYVVTREQSRS